MGEDYVRPPLVPREATPAWVVAWRFRVVALALMAVVIVLGFRAYQHFSGATDQDPGIGAAGVPVATSDVTRQR